MDKIINIKKANYLNDCKISFEFNDDVQRTVDSEKFLFSSAHPHIRKYQNQKLFQKFNLDYGEIEWNDSELAFPIYDLYKGQI